MADAKKFGMRVSQILDKTTVVITGDGIDRVKVGDSLYILAVGPLLEGVNVPLVVKKAELEADSVTKYYVIARTPEYEATVPDALSSIALGFGPKKVFKRDALSVDEKTMVGNPAWQPVSVKDPVVKVDELSQFVDTLAAQFSPQQAQKG